MGRLVIAWLVGVGVSPVGAGQPERFEFSRVEMAVPVRIVLYAHKEVNATRAADAALARITELDAVLSDYDPQSELRRLSETAGRGQPVPVSEDLWRVLSRAQTISRRSDGAFDVTVGPLSRLWRRAHRRHRLPSPERLEQARKLTGYRLIRLDPEHRTVELLQPGMRLDAGGIAKGYAVDEALKVLRRRGLGRALVDAGGDLALGDPPPGRPGWRIGVARLGADGPPDRLLLLSRVAVATSGDTWQYAEIDGRRYSHIVDPRTGVGLVDHSSVTVVAPEGMVADALASAVSVLGPKQGLALVENTPGAEALIVCAPKGEVETYRSSGWRDLPLAPSQ